MEINLSSIFKLKNPKGDNEISTDENWYLKKTLLRSRSIALEIIEKMKILSKITRF